MKKITKQTLLGISINLMFIPVLISFVLFTDGRLNWWVPLVLFLVCLGLAMGLEKVLGPDAIYVQWKKEGYDNKKQWIKESKSFTAKMIRYHFTKGWKYSIGFYALVMIIWLITKN